MPHVAASHQPTAVPACLPLDTVAVVVQPLPPLGALRRLLIAGLELADELNEPPGQRGRAGYTAFG